MHVLCVYLPLITPVTFLWFEISCDQVLTASQSSRCRSYILWRFGCQVGLWLSLKNYRRICSFLIWHLSDVMSIINRLLPLQFHKVKNRMERGWGENRQISGWRKVFLLCVDVGREPSPWKLSSCRNQWKSKSSWFCHLTWQKWEKHKTKL